MRPIAEIEPAIERAAAASELLALGEEVLEHWVIAKGNTPTKAKSEGFRLLALHRQGAKGEPSFNACRETCRELAYHYNLLMAEPDHIDTAHRLAMMRLIASHVYYFVSGKLQIDQLGEFCCSSRDLRLGGSNDVMPNEPRTET